MGEQDYEGARSVCLFLYPDGENKEDLLLGRVSQTDIMKNTVAYDANWIRSERRVRYRDEDRGW
jgi:hypothetical protein